MFNAVAENLQPFDKQAKELFNLNKNALVNFLSEIEKRGIKYLDFNPGPIKKDKEKIVKFFIKSIEELSNLNILIDSTDSELIELAIGFSKNKPIINGFSMEEKKLKNILPLAKKYDLSIVGLLMADGFIPRTMEEKILMAEEMINSAKNEGVKSEQIIIDPIIAPLGWDGGLDSNRANLEFLKEARNLFQGVKYIVGISNLTTKSAGGLKKSYFQNIFISILWSYKIDFILLDAFDRDIVNTVRFLKLLEGGGVFSFAEFVS